VSTLAGAPRALLAAAEALATLPGIGPKTAMRLALALLARKKEEVQALAEAIARLPQEVHFCPRCGAFAEQGRCAICDDARRDRTKICVVEQPVDVLLMERSGAWRGLYHVLHGRLSPIDGVDAEKLNLAPLDQRIADGGIEELILATSATVDGEATAHFIARRYRAHGIKISRIARGIPEGGELEYLDEFTLKRALDARIAWDA